MPQVQPIIVSLCFVWAAATTTSADAQSSLLREAIGLDGTIMWANSGAPGMVLAVVRGRETLVQGYGETGKGTGQEPTGRSLLRLGSVSKVFATEVLASMAADGSVRLTDPLQRYAPAGVNVPRFGDREITLLDLATHSAGLPREIGSAPSDAPPLTSPTKEQRWRFLGGYQLPWAPGTVVAYSNIGFNLLGDALGIAAGKDYSVLLHDRITGPLVMADTGFAPTTQQCELLMTGSGIGGAAPCVDTAAIAGAGGIYSTGDDMVLWLRHNLEATDPAVWPTLALAHAVYRQRQTMTAAIGLDEAGDADGIALGWVVLAAHGHTPLIVQKTGALAGFMTYIAFAPGLDVGLFVAVNRVEFATFHGLAAAANNLLTALAPR